MAKIALIERKCDRCLKCVPACPFGSVRVVNGLPHIDESCRLCGLCVRACPNGALMLLEAMRTDCDRSRWWGVMVFVEMQDGQPHPVALELMGKARELAAVRDEPVCCVVIGHGAEPAAREMLHYGAGEALTYDGAVFSLFRADVFAAALEDAVRFKKPSVVLVGATPLGRSLAPRAATRFRTGLTADCTRLEMRENGDLVQIRPAFGGNIMAQIITPYTRPQFATVRYKVMNAPPRDQAPSGVVTPRKIPLAAYASRIEPLSAAPMPKAANISEARVLVAGGRGLKRRADMDLLRDLAEALGGEVAVTRPLVERGWADGARQIGLSGRTVRPELIFTFGISGAIQFTAGMERSKRIVAVNTDPDAPIFSVAHIGVVADLYDVIPALMRAAKEG